MPGYQRRADEQAGRRRTRPRNPPDLHESPSAGSSSSRTENRSATPAGKTATTRAIRRKRSRSSSGWRSSMRRSATIGSAFSTCTRARRSGRTRRVRSRADRRRRCASIADRQQPAAVDLQRRIVIRGGNDGLARLHRSRVSGHEILDVVIDEPDAFGRKARELRRQRADDLGPHDEWLGDMPYGEQRAAPEAPTTKRHRHRSSPAANGSRARQRHFARRRAAGPQITADSQGDQRDE